jgi:hypothetical protein
MVPGSRQAALCVIARRSGVQCRIGFQPVSGRAARHPRKCTSSTDSGPVSKASPIGAGSYPKFRTYGFSFCRLPVVVRSTPGRESSLPSQPARRGLGWGGSAPVVEDVEAGAAVSRFVGPVHGDDQGLGPKTARHHLQIGLLAGEIDPGEEVRHPEPPRRASRSCRGARQSARRPRLLAARRRI